MTKRQDLPILDPGIPVTGKGEDYFLSLFSDSKKLLSHSFHAEKAWKHFSVILEEVGQSRSRYLFYLSFLISSVRIGATLLQ